MCSWMNCAQVVIFGFFSFLDFLSVFFSSLFRLDKIFVSFVIEEVSSNDGAFHTYIHACYW